MSQSFTFQNAPVELLDVPQLVLLTDTTQKVDTLLMDRFFPQRVSYTKICLLYTSDAADE